jgi:tetratricopeptide (TPR) repeat protein
MKLSQARAALFLLALAALATNTGCINRIRAKNQLNEGARAYKSGHFQEAEEHFRRAKELDPEQKNTDFFIARSIQSQYKPGVDNPENKQLAQAAIDQYMKVLQQDPNNPQAELAYSSIAYLYKATGQEDKQIDWITKRANDPNAPPDKRAQALIVLASMKWQCSYNVTEQTNNKATVMKDNKALVQYKKPKEQKDFDQAKQCAADGLKLAEQAISLDPNNEQAWSYKTNLLLELGKLDEMDGKTDQATQDRKQANDAQQKTLELSEANKKKKDEEEKAKAEKEKAG